LSLSLAFRRGPPCFLISLDPSQALFLSWIVWRACRRPLRRTSEHSRWRLLMKITLDLALLIGRCSSFWSEDLSTPPPAVNPSSPPHNHGTFSPFSFPRRSSFLIRQTGHFPAIGNEPTPMAPRLSVKSATPHVLSSFRDGADIYWHASFFCPLPPPNSLPMWILPIMAFAWLPGLGAGPRAFFRAQTS